jgi:hypothetical protein
MHFDRTVLAYHGCDERVAKRLLAGESFQASINAYDWLGHGIYFWEFGPHRALKFAELQQKRGKVQKPNFVGVELRLGLCFDLLDTRFTEDLAVFYPLWVKQMRQKRVQLPTNEGKAPYFLKRYRDCAILNDYLHYLADFGKVYDAVRGCFLEGKRVFPKSGIYREAHIQIAVRNPRCILRVFDPTIEPQ